MEPLAACEANVAETEGKVMDFEELVRELIWKTQLANALQQIGSTATVTQVHDALASRDAVCAAVVAAYRVLEERCKNSEEAVQSWATGDLDALGIGGGE